MTLYLPSVRYYSRVCCLCFFFSSRRRHTRCLSDWSSDVCSSDLWCDKVNSTYKKYIRAVPRELFAVERLHLKALPVWIPEVYRLKARTVDVEGYVSVN